jgi:hypothetical protein
MKWMFMLLAVSSFIAGYFVKDHTEVIKLWVSFYGNLIIFAVFMAQEFIIKEIKRWK